MIKDTAQQDVMIERSLKGTYLKWGASFVAIVALISMAVATIGDERSVSRKGLIVDKVELGRFERDVLATGKIVAANAPTLFATEQGVVTLLKQSGEPVSVGEVIAQIHSPQLESLLDQQRTVLDSLTSNMASLELENRSIMLAAEKQMDLASVDLQAARRELKRADQLLTNDIISRLDYDKHVDDLAKRELQHKHATKEFELIKDTLAFKVSQAKSELQRQKIAVDEVERRMAALQIVSPVDGAVGSWVTENKAQVTMGTPVISVVDLTAYQAELRVPDVYGDDLVVGMGVELSIAGQKVEAALISISPEIQGNQVVARAQVVDSDELSLRQNQRLSARVFLEQIDNALTVRKGAFLDSTGGAYVYRIEEDRAVRVPIVLGASGAADIQIAQGVKVGDELIISSYDKMKGAEVVRIN